MPGLGKYSSVMGRFKFQGLNYFVFSFQKGNPIKSCEVSTGLLIYYLNNRELYEDSFYKDSFQGKSLTFDNFLC